MIKKRVKIVVLDEKNPHVRVVQVMLVNAGGGLKPQGRFAAALLAENHGG